MMKSNTIFRFQGQKYNEITFHPINFVFAVEFQVNWTGLYTQVQCIIVEFYNPKTHAMILEF